MGRPYPKESIALLVCCKTQHPVALGKTNDSYVNEGCVVKSLADYLRLLRNLGCSSPLGKSVSPPIFGPFFS